MTFLKIKPDRSTAYCVANQQIEFSSHTLKIVEQQNRSIIYIILLLLSLLSFNTFQPKLKPLHLQKSCSICSK